MTTTQAETDRAKEMLAAFRCRAEVSYHATLRGEGGWCAEGGLQDIPGDEYEYDRLCLAGVAIRYDAEVDDDTETLSAKRLVWKYKPADRRGRHGNNGDWQTRTKWAGIVRASTEAIRDWADTPGKAVEALRVQRRAWADRQTARAEKMLAEAAQCRDEACRPQRSDVGPCDCADCVEGLHAVRTR